VKDIQKFLQQLVNNGTITPNSNSYYPIHFSIAVTSIGQGGTYSCAPNGFCAYHNTFNAGTDSNPIIVAYGVMPDQTTSGCKGYCGRSSDTFQNTCAVSSHELIEAITDPYGGLGLLNYLGWYSFSRNGEIGDMCNQVSSFTTDGNGNKWFIQKGWSNRYGKCYAPP
jgi:hypothetical protein